MNIIDKTIAYVSPSRGAKRARDRAVMRIVAGYDASGNGPRNDGWVRGSDKSQNQLNKMSLKRLRQVNRELVRNNAYASAAVDATVSYTVGEGIMPAIKCDDENKRKLLQELLDEWAGSTFCDAAGQLSLTGLQSLVVRSESESGEALAMREIQRNSKVRVPLRIRILEGDFLDDTKETKTTIQGVEFSDNYGREIKGYWIHQSHPGEMAALRSTSKFVKREDIAHIYEIKRPGQVRGIPRGTAVVQKLRQLDDFQDARLMQQKVAACLAGAIVQGEEGEAQGDVLPAEIHPGMLPMLGRDQDIRFFTPPSVSGQQEFIKGEEHLIAKGYGLTYQALTGDLSDANFANGKMGRLDMYANIRRWRNNMLIPMFCKRVGVWFLEACELIGIDTTGVTIKWNPPRTEILNLKDDLPAIKNKIRSGLGTLSGELRSLGINDIDAFFEEYKADLEKIDKLGLVLDCDPRHTGGNGQTQGTKQEEGTEE